MQSNSFYSETCLYNDMWEIYWDTQSWHMPAHFPPRLGVSYTFYVLQHWLIIIQFDHTVKALVFKILQLYSIPGIH